MGTPVVLTDEQFALLQRVEAETARLTRDPKLKDDPEEMRAAGALLTEAENLKLPEVSLVNLRNWVNLYG